MCSSKANNRMRSRSLKWKKGFYNNAVFDMITLQRIFKFIFLKFLLFL